MRIGFLSSQNYYSQSAFSGTLYSMHRALRRRPGVTVIDLGWPRHPGLIQKVRDRLAGPLDLRKDAQRRRFHGRVSRQLSRSRPDVVFAPQCSVELDIVRPRLPVVYSTDATFRLLSGTYELGLAPEEEARREAFEQAALGQATRLLLPSRWASDSAIADYGVDPERIDRACYGANLVDVPRREEIDRPHDPGRLRLLFVGRDYVRKGGPLALEALRALRASGVNAELTVVGCVPPETADGLEVIPYIDKNVPEQVARLRDLYLGSHFLLFPTRADCSPISLCEAAAFGLPAVSSSVGGIPDIVEDGVSGLLIAPDAGGDAYAAKIADAYRDPAAYGALARGSRRAYDLRLNWDAWAAQAEATLRQALRDQTMTAR